MGDRKKPIGRGRRDPRSHVRAPHAAPRAKELRLEIPLSRAVRSMKSHDGDVNGFQRRAIGDLAGAQVADAGVGNEVEVVAFNRAGGRGS